MSVAIIPARGGSKRIPKKNIRYFAGQPIISYSINSAINSRLFDRVVVSTDSEEIAEIAISYGAEVPFLRPKELSDDFCGTNPVVAHTLKNLDIEYKFACCIYPTAPLMRVKDLQKGYELIQRGGVEFVFSSVKYDYNPFRGFTLKGDSPKILFPEYMKSRSQDLDEVYHDAAQFYWGRREAFIDDKELFSQSSKVVSIHPLYVQDIDTLEDWVLAEMKFKAIHES